MKKVIVLLFLAISFVLMILISYMKFQSALYFDSGDYSTKHHSENIYLNDLSTDPFQGYNYNY